ncbi:MAG TPA: VCBS repeat-containing protein, partial [Bdellovibrionota bacterium]|nr:VCBS repeat-containing protein [Bdellovibrionota bacterium]
IYSDAGCTALLATGVGAAGTVQVTLPYQPDGAHSYYAQGYDVPGDASNVSACSAALLSYTVTSNLDLTQPTNVITLANNPNSIAFANLDDRTTDGSDKFIYGMIAPSPTSSSINLVWPSGSDPQWVTPIESIPGRGHETAPYYNAIDGDTKIDLVTLDTTGHMAVYKGTGSGSFSVNPVLFDATGVDANDTPVDMKFTDLNGDGHNDAVIATKSRVLVYLGTHDSAMFGSKTVFDPGMAPTSLILADFDDDTKWDVAVISSASGIVLMKGDGSGALLAPSTVTNTTGITQGVATDLAHDGGGLDFVVNLSSGGAFGTIANNGVGGFGALTAHGTYRGPVMVQASDMDSMPDGAPEVVVANVDHPELGVVTVYFNDGLGNFNSLGEDLLPLDEAPVAVYLLDEDLNFGMDIVILTASGKVYVILNTQFFIG